MIEASLQKQLAAGLRSQGCFVTKIPDLARAVVKPFDLVIGYDHKFYPVEVKFKKYRRKSPITENDVVIAKDFFRPHQLPTLRAIFEANQGLPYVAAFVGREHNDRISEIRGWFIPVWLFDRRESWTRAQLQEQSGPPLGLDWVPAVGWTVPWMAKE